MYSNCLRLVLQVRIVAADLITSTCCALADNASLRDVKICKARQPGLKVRVNFQVLSS